MGQYDVLDFLKNKRAYTDEYFTVRDIEKGMQSIGFSNGVIKGVNHDLRRLALFNSIQYRGVGIWNHKKLFRAKKS